MDTRLLPYYEQELQYIREAGAEFAADYPKIASRLGIETLDCSDPYVERLIESFAFLSARIQLKLDAEVPRFTQHMLELVYPHFLCPTPSACIVQFIADANVGELADGYGIPRNTSIKSGDTVAEQSSCEFRTAQDVHLWPIEVSEAAFYNRDVSSLSLPASLRSATAALRIRLRLTGGISWKKLTLSDLPIFLTGPDEVPVSLYEQIVANSIGVLIEQVQEPKPNAHLLPRESIVQMGFDEDQRLLPQTGRSFEGYAFLQEYFVLPERFQFIQLEGLRPALNSCEGSEVDIIIALNGGDTNLGRMVDSRCFQLHCTPAVNLFPVKADAVHVAAGDIEHHVVPDRTRPLDFEVFSIKDVVGLGSSTRKSIPFHPLFHIEDIGVDVTEKAYYTINRVPRVVSSRQQRKGQRSSYLGSEVFLAIVDGRDSTDEKVDLLAVNLLCTNRDLPLQIPIGTSDSDFEHGSGAPAKAIKCISGPTSPLPSRAHAQGDLLWRTVNHLSLNYLSLVNQDKMHGATALRSLLSIYGNEHSGTDLDATLRKQIEGVHSIESKSIVRQLPGDGLVSFCRGLEIQLTLDERQFKGRGSFLLGAVLEQFFSRYVSINSFTETVLKSLQRGEIVRWPARLGRRHLI